MQFYQDDGYPSERAPIPQLVLTLGYHTDLCYWMRHMADV